MAERIRQLEERNCQLEEENRLLKEKLVGSRPLDRPLDRLENLLDRLLENRLNQRYSHQRRCMQKRVRLLEWDVSLLQHALRNVPPTDR